ncbi:hypothetical protein CLV46_0823 [Diaminobutyricimonas aerilata]|uniref:Uncharacterized protein n=1 Tax=Diaminobutyricimonas aerilata TaxID=1162967 RepID=A0A2M9CHD3_9MICO|nr:hypothetical protein [Diaminobutyricimonas aerilata]PJJ71280.1 hypothetical protein CLV46_0823 [Diaminobutyricimonas aerilata]
MSDIDDTTNDARDESLELRREQDREVRRLADEGEGSGRNDDADAPSPDHHNAETESDTESGGPA